MEQFYAELNVLKANIGKNNTLLSDKRYDEFEKKILMLRCLKTKKNPLDFWLQKRTVLLTVAEWHGSVLNGQRDGDAQRLLLCLRYFLRLILMDRDDKVNLSAIYSQGFRDNPSDCL
ncbi:hypothetical protein QTP88_012675 [Uroleucon formosanum]